MLKYDLHYIIYTKIKIFFFNFSQTNNFYLLLLGTDKHFQLIITCIVIFYFYLLHNSNNVKSIEHILNFSAYMFNMTYKQMIYRKITLI